jgi:hypothetical protein
MDMDSMSLFGEEEEQLIYHLSERPLQSSLLEPKIPYTAGEAEDQTIPRICFSKSIGGCLSSIGPSQITLGPNMEMIEDFPEFFVYVPPEGGSMAKIVDTPELVEKRLVSDAEATGEVWVVEPMLVSLFGKIKPLSVKVGEDRIPRYTYKFGFYGPGGLIWNDEVLCD